MDTEKQRQRRRDDARLTESGNARSEQLNTRGAYRVANQQSLAWLSGSERRRPGWFLDMKYQTCYPLYNITDIPSRAAEYEANCNCGSRAKRGMKFCGSSEILQKRASKISRDYRAHELIYGTVPQENMWRYEGFLFLLTKTTCPVIWYEISATGSAVVITIEVAALIMSDSHYNSYIQVPLYNGEKMSETH